MSIAAIIPTYNAAAFIEGTLASVFAQTQKPDEVIVVDDASTDNTAAMARRLGATVIVLPKNTGGPAVPFNTGIAASRSDWIAALDHDDRWTPDWLASSMQTVGDLNVEFVFGRVTVTPANPGMQADIDGMYARLRDENAIRNAIRLPARRAYNALIHDHCIAVTCSSMVFSRRIGIDIGFDPAVHRCCDYRILQRVTAREDIGFVDSVCCEWVSSPNSLYQQERNMDTIDRELIYAYKLFQTNDPAARRKLRDRCRRTANDLAYAARTRGEYRRAFADYWDSLRYGGLNRTAAVGLLKLPLALLRGK